MSRTHRSRMGKRGGAYAHARFRRGLLVVTYVAGFLAFGTTLAALIELQGVQTIVQIIHAPTRASVNWTQFGFDATGTRNNPAEFRITKTNVAHLHMLWRSKLPDIADSTPVLLHALPFLDGNVRNVLYLTIKSGSLL